MPNRKPNAVANTAQKSQPNATPNVFLNIYKKKAVPYPMQQKTPNASLNAAPNGVLNTVLIIALNTVPNANNNRASLFINSDNEDFP